MLLMPQDMWVHFVFATENAWPFMLTIVSLCPSPQRPYDVGAQNQVCQPQQTAKCISAGQRCKWRSPNRILRRAWSCAGRGDLHRLRRLWYRGKFAYTNVAWRIQIRPTARFNQSSKEALIRGLHMKYVCYYQCQRIIRCYWVIARLRVSILMYMHNAQCLM